MTSSEEVAKFRAARRLWARLMRGRYGAPDAACRLRFQIREAAYRVQLDIEAGMRIVVGVNAFEQSEEGVRIGQPDYSALGGRQKAKLADLRRRRDAGGVEAALGRVRETARGEGNLLPPSSRPSRRWRRWARSATR